MSKGGRSLPSTLKALISAPTFTLSSSAAPSASRAAAASAASTSGSSKQGRPSGPSPAPKEHILNGLFDKLSGEANDRGVGWGEWMSLATATMFTLNSPRSLQSLHRYTTSNQSDLQERVNRACLMREVGLKCIGFIGIPKVINNLAAIRAVVEQDSELANALPTEPRRRITQDILPDVTSSAYALWDDIYQPHSQKLLGILGKSHPDLPVFIVESEYGPLFQMPSAFRPSSSQKDPEWEVNRLRTSLVAIAALRAQGGVGPQVTSHVWGLMKAEPSIASSDARKQGLQWLTSQDGAEWAIKTVDSICAAIEGAKPEDLQEPEQKRESKL